MPFFKLTRNGRDEPHPAGCAGLNWGTIIFCTEHRGGITHRLRAAGFDELTEQAAVAAAHAGNMPIIRVSPHPNGQGIDKHSYEKINLEAAGLPRVSEEFKNQLVACLADPRVRDVLRVAHAGGPHPGHVSLFQHTDSPTEATPPATT